eukprot:711102-Amphidinium_carterae.1
MLGPVVHSLALGIYDLVLVQETWLLEGSIRSAAFKAEQMGYEGAFTPARKDKALGRGKGGLAVLSRVGTPMLRATTSPQADLGRWMYVVETQRYWPELLRGLLLLQLPKPGAVGAGGA